MRNSASIVVACLTFAGAVQPFGAFAQETGPSENEVYVDHGGVLRWTGSDEEVALFGVNYTTPFAHAYRAHLALGMDPRKAIERDVAHFKRLGLDAFRVHVWDREISDRAGNLIDNEHLDLFDYLLKRLKDADIKIVLTPIAWWGTGYPEPDMETGGFSDAFTKEEMTHDPDALLAMERYLPQFIDHVNPYTGLSYANDPDILFIELFNEPWHTEPFPEQTAFINKLVGAVRDTGFDKPIFYNINERYSEGHAKAVCSADIQGVGAQWYPTGLVGGRTIEANMLPNVNRYTIPYGNMAECHDKARMAYEFEAPDVAASYMYPAIARSFRAAGFQFAVMFSYDPLAIAPHNTEYQTHYLNLVYTPAKAISLMIAAEAFRRQPLGGSYPNYPANNAFGPFRVSYPEGLSEMLTDQVFLYSGSTSSKPAHPELLERVAGVGNSPVVAYAGTGAYFLDRIDSGVWRLEVYPDVVQIADPFARASLDRDVVRIYWKMRRMEVNLPDLGRAFGIRASDQSGEMVGNADDLNRISVRPGVYLLYRTNVEPNQLPSGWNDGFFAPDASYDAAIVVHHPPSSVVADQVFKVDAAVATAVEPDSVSLFVRRIGWRGFARFEMNSVAPFRYEGLVPKEFMRPGPIEYAIAVHEGGQSTTFPGPEPGHPREWDFTGTTFWRTIAVAASDPVVLFEADRDVSRMLWPRPSDYVPFTSTYVPGSTPDRTALQVVVPSFEPEPHMFQIRNFVPPQDRQRLSGPTVFDRIVVHGKSATDRPVTINVSIVDRDGSVWGGVVDLGSDWADHGIFLDSLEHEPLALLPRPFPSFLPFHLEIGDRALRPQIDRIEGIQITLTGSDEGDSSPSESGSPPDGVGFTLQYILLESGK